MIYITGDTHTPIDIHKLGNKFFQLKTQCHISELKRDDYVIICGDSGFVWDNSKSDCYWQKWLNGKPWTTLFIDGNHENHTILDGMKVCEWNGGKVHFVQSNIIHLMRGQVFDIDGLQFFTMGGAESHDKEYRIENKSWWQRELPNRKEYDEALKNLNGTNWSVDYVLTHCCPAQIQCLIDSQLLSNELTQFLGLVMNSLNFKDWYFGHYHKDADYNDKFHCVYNDVLRIK